MFVVAYGFFTIYMEHFKYKAVIVETDDVYHYIGELVSNKQTCFKDIVFKKVENIEIEKEKIIKAGYKEVEENIFLYE